MYHGVFATITKLTAENTIQTSTIAIIITHVRYGSPLQKHMQHLTNFNFHSLQVRRHYYEVDMYKCAYIFVLHLNTNTKKQ